MNAEATRRLPAEMTNDPNGMLGGLPRPIAGPPATTTDRVERVKSYHASCLQAFSDQMGYAFLIGVELLAIKEELPHGDFMAWRQKHLPEIAHRTATQYMKFVEKLTQRFPTVGKLATVSNFKMLPSGELSTAGKETVLKAVHEAADGKTFTEMYRDLGVIRQPKAPAWHPRKPAKDLTADDAVKLRRDMATQAWGAIELKLESYGADFVLLTDLQVDSQIAFLEQHLSARKRWRNKPRGKRDAQEVATYLKAKP